MCASHLFDNYYFIKNQTKYLTVFVVKSVKKTRNSSAFFNKKKSLPVGAQKPKDKTFCKYFNCSNPYNV